jgi:hypothetical protein
MVEVSNCPSRLAAILVRLRTAPVVPEDELPAAPDGVSWWTAERLDHGTR